MSPAAPLRYRFARFELQPDERRLLADGQAAQIGPRAFDLLLALVERDGRLVTKEQLLARVWGKVVVEENALQAHVSALRKVLGPEAIATVSGQGYRFVLEVTPVADAPPVGAAPPQCNLPLALTSFIGREREIGKVRQLLGEARLLTLTGAGGCGKTRLALEVARAELNGYPGGVWLVELAPLAEPTLVAQAVAKAMGIDPQPGQDIVETLLAGIGTRRLLVVLDNAEHLVEASARLSDTLLRRCAGLSILATSRERLAVEGELTWRVPPLSVPAGIVGEDLLAFEASRLFIERAQLQHPDFAVLAEDRPALVSICRRLDGMALAIELAAPRVRMMSLQALSAQLDQRFRLLVGGSRPALPRQRTLRSLIDWSHDLLNPAEQALLRRVSVFAGGCTLKAAEQVCSGNGIEPDEVAELLTALVDKSLMTVETSASEPRFGMLETVRHYGLERLRAADEEASVRERLVEYLITLAAGLDAPTDAVILPTLSRLDAELANLRAALAWGADSPERAAQGLRLAGLLNWFWLSRELHAEGRDWLTRLLQAAGESGSRELRARALHGIGVRQISENEHVRARESLRQAEALWRELGDRKNLGHTLSGLSDAEYFVGNLQAFRDQAEETLAIGRETGDLRLVASALQRIGRLAFRRGDLAEAEAVLNDALTAARVVGPSSAFNVLQLLSTVQLGQHQFDGARAALLEGLACARELRHRNYVAGALINYARFLLEAQDPAAARANLREAQQWLRYGEQWQSSLWLDTWGLWLAAVGRVIDAARLWGCASAARARMSAQAVMRMQQRQEEVRRSYADLAAFERAWADGATWSLEDGLSWARQVDVARATELADRPSSG
jgi:non-specific serine/threonine protein kinase